MKNVESWEPTKFEYRGGRLRASRDPARVGRTSRVVGDRVAAFYQYSIPKFARGDLLDLGCGRVPLYEAYRDAVDSVTCVDWGNSPHDLAHADVYADLNEPLPIEDNRFDTIVCSDVLEHLFAPATAVGEMGRVLRPGGVALLNAPFYYWLHEAPYDFHRYTEFALRRLFTDNGFEIEALFPLGGKRDILVDTGTKMLGGGRRVAGAVAGAIQTAYAAVTALDCEAAQKKRPSAFPLAYGVIARAGAIA